jgi:hypothetical protein
MAIAEVQHSKGLPMACAERKGVALRWIALISARAPGGYPPAPYAFLSRAKFGAMQVMLGSLERFASRRAQA